MKRDRWHLQNYQCPITYCMCLKSTDGEDCFNYFNHSDPNAQCHPSRTGIVICMAIQYAYSQVLLMLHI